MFHSREYSQHHGNSSPISGTIVLLECRNYTKQCLQCYWMPDDPLTTPDIPWPKLFHLINLQPTRTQSLTLAVHKPRQIYLIRRNEMRCSICQDIVDRRSELVKLNSVEQRRSYTSTTPSERQHHINGDSLQSAATLKASLRPKSRVDIRFSNGVEPKLLFSCANRSGNLEYGTLGMNTLLELC